MICWVSHQALLYKAVKHSYFHPNMASSTFRSELIELMHWSGKTIPSIWVLLGFINICQAIPFFNFCFYCSILMWWCYPQLFSPSPILTRYITRRVKRILTKKIMSLILVLPHFHLKSSFFHTHVYSYNSGSISDLSYSLVSIHSLHSYAHS